MESVRAFSDSTEGNFITCVSGPADPSKNDSERRRREAVRLHGCIQVTIRRWRVKWTLVPYCFCLDGEHNGGKFEIIHVVLKTFISFFMDVCSLNNTRPKIGRFSDMEVDSVVRTRSFTLPVKSGCYFPQH